MIFQDHEIQEFIEAWKADFGETLTRGEAEMEMNCLLDFFCTVAEKRAELESKKEEK